MAKNISKEIVETIEEDELSFNEDTMKFGKVSGCDKLRVRQEANAEAEVLAEIEKDSEVVILGEKDGFYNIVTETGVEGYSMKKFII